MSCNKVDADGLENFVILHSQYNLQKEGTHSEKQYFVHSNQFICDIPIDVEHLYFSGCGNDLTALDFSSFGFTHLRVITIGNVCFQNVRFFELDGMSELESVKIDANCFRVSYFERGDGVCRITNCPSLCELEIGDRTFYDFNQFELSNVNSLQSIRLGEYCFRYADMCILKSGRRRKVIHNVDLPSLQYVLFGSYSFALTDGVIFEGRVVMDWDMEIYFKNNHGIDLPKLTTISFTGSWALQGDCGTSRKVHLQDHDSYSNTLIMKSI